mmetsp:Transcript_1/g.13  ORF Transcript_1/g.13 Transcript_1/m.13 type:complete len:359 (+) Transcript_1:42-1118(+)
MAVVIGRRGARSKAPRHESEAELGLRLLLQRSIVQASKHGLGIGQQPSVICVQTLNVPCRPEHVLWRGPCEARPLGQNLECLLRRELPNTGRHKSLPRLRQHGVAIREGAALRAPQGCQEGLRLGRRQRQERAAIPQRLKRREAGLTQDSRGRRERAPEVRVAVACEEGRGRLGREALPPEVLREKAGQLCDGLLRHGTEARRPQSPGERDEGRGDGEGEDASLGLQAPQVLGDEVAQALGQLRQNVEPQGIGAVHFQREVFRQRETVQKSADFLHGLGQHRGLTTLLGQYVAYGIPTCFHTRGDLLQARLQDPGAIDGSCRLRSEALGPHPRDLEEVRDEASNLRNLGLASRSPTEP